MDRLPIVLCVDDEAVVLQSLRDQLRQQFVRRVRVEVAGDAAEALELVEELAEEGAPLPVVISDHIMPGLKGDELLARIHQRLPDTRTILLTGLAGADAVGRAVNHGALYRYIAKPWDRDDLILTVREAIASFETEALVRRQQERLANAHAAAQRFVPFGFLARLGRTELTEVRRGDSAELEMSMFMSDIRGFTAMLDARDGPANVGWINEYLAWMEPPIHDQGGFIENVTGDGINAMFGDADGAVRAAVDSLLALADYNRFRAAGGAAPIRIGIGINTGPMTLGVVGGADRLKCSAVGDAANLAARVEGLTKHLGACLVTGSTRARLSDPDRFAMRFVDRLRVAGRSSVTELWEVLDGLPEDERARKLATRDRLDRATARLATGDLAGATRAFTELAAADPTDRAFEWYLARCHRLADEGLPVGWDGVAVLTRK